jgi:hypothetical protein
VLILLQVHYKDLEKFCSKLTEVVTRKEIKKYRENKTQVRNFLWLFSVLCTIIGHDKFTVTKFIAVKQILG